MKISLSIILDTVFYFVAGFFLAFIAFNFFLTRPASYVISATFALIFTIFGVKSSIDKSQKKFSSKEKEKVFNTVMTFLAISGDKTVSDLFDKLFKAEGFSTEKRRGGIFIAQKNTVAFFKFGFDEVTKTDIVKCFNKIGKSQKTEIFSENFSEEVKEFAVRFGGKVILTDGRETFSRLENHSLLPKSDFTLSNDKKSKFSLGRLLNKKRAAHYLAFGLLFTFLSYFAPIKGYYIAFGALFLIAALIIRLFGKTAA